MPVVYIHGPHGPANHLLAEELHNLMPRSEIIDDGLNVGPAKAAAKNNREYQALRTSLRRKNLQRIYKSESASETTWIIVDRVWCKTHKAALAADYEFAAVSSHTPLISVIPKLDLEFGVKMAKEDTKNPETRSAILQQREEFRDKCNQQEVFRFRNDYELELDVTIISPTMAAEKVRAHIQTVKRRPETKEKHSWIRIY